MKVANAPDKRPAIAFDNINEVLTIVNALKYYRQEMIGDQYIKKLELLIDEHEKVVNKFKASKSG